MAGAGGAHGIDPLPGPVVAVYLAVLPLWPGWVRADARSVQLLFALLVFAAQVAVSHAWLARFRFGPVEWLWRAMTYRQWPPMRRGAGQG